MANGLSTIRQDLVVSGAGHIILIPYDGKGILNKRAAYSTANGTLDNISYELATNTVEINDGNAVYPAAILPTTSTGTITFQMNTYDPQLQSLISGSIYKAGTSDASDTEMWILETGTVEEITVDSAKEYRIVLTHASNNIENIIITDEFGNLYEPISTGTPTAQQVLVTVDADTKTTILGFNEAENQKGFNINYSYNATSTKDVKYRNTPKIPNFQVIVVYETQSIGATTYQRVNVVFDNCTATSANPPTQSNDPTGGWTITINLTQPRKGKAPVIVRMEDITDEEVEKAELNLASLS